MISLTRIISTTMWVCMAGWLWAAPVPTISVIPQPQSVIMGEGSFNWTRTSKIIYAPTDSAALAVAQLCVPTLRTATGWALKTEPSIGRNVKNALVFERDASITNPEAYRLKVTPQGIRVNASGYKGYFYAIQTLFQLMPVAVYGKSKASIAWKVPAVTIQDSPRLAYRGLHLDVSRHFFPVDSIKKYLDAMAMHKLNTFHWHLTDDQGWRLEIKKYPLLTSVGAQRDSILLGHFYDNYPQKFEKETHNGYYTQAQARDIVEYARLRGITVIPEIEMPGHAVAALAAYPWLSCSRKPLKVGTRWSVFKDVYCTRDSVFDFLENVLTEVMAIFPSTYIHIGGDECPKDRWKECPDCQGRMKQLHLKDENELQSYFIHRIEKFLNAHGRQIIGWDEILEGGLAPNATVMSWRGTEGGIEAARAHHKVIMTPGAYCYLDYYQGWPTDEPVTIGGYLPLRKMYSFEPVPEFFDSIQASYIEGVQASVWTEYMKDFQRVQYMVFPRLAALAELGWTTKENKNETRFLHSLATQIMRYDRMGIQHSEVYNYVEPDVTKGGDGLPVIRLSVANPDGKIRYTTDGTLPGTMSTLYQEPLALKNTTRVRAAVFVQDTVVVGKEMDRTFIVDKCSGLIPTVRIEEKMQMVPNIEMLTDGVIGNTRTTWQWLRLGHNEEVELVVDLAREDTISQLAIGFLIAPALNNYLPSKIEISVSSDGANYQRAGNYISGYIRKTGAWEIVRPQINFSPVRARYVKIVLGSGGEGINPDYDFGRSAVAVDELEIH